MATFLARPECRDGKWHIVTYNISDPARWVETEDVATSQPCTAAPPTIEPAPDTVIVDPPPPPPPPPGPGGPVVAPPAVPICDQPACKAATTTFLLQQITADNLATLSRDACRQWKSLGVAAAAAAGVAVAAAAAAVKICAATAWWAPYFCAAAWTVSGLAGIASVAAAALATKAMVIYQKRLTTCRTAMTAKTTAYRAMVNACGRECAKNTGVSCSC